MKLKLVNPESRWKRDRLRRRVDELVYKLYGLTEEEIKIIEEV